MNRYGAMSVAAYAIILAVSTGRGETPAAPATSLPPPTPSSSDEPPPRVVSHWYGEAHLTRESYAGGGPGGAFGVALSTPHSKTEATMTAVLREEIDPLLKRRVIVESISWTSSVSDLYYVNPDKSKVPAGKGGKGSGTLTEKELYLSYDLSGFQQAVTDAKQSVDGLTTKAQEAHRQAVAADEALAKTQVRLTALSAAAASAAGRYHDSTATPQQKAQAKQQMQDATEASKAATRDYVAKVTQARLADNAAKSAEGDLLTANGKLRGARSMLAVMETGHEHAHASADLVTDSKTGQNQAIVSVSLNGDLTAYKVDIIPLKLDGFQVSLAKVYKPATVNAALLSFTVKGPVEKGKFDAKVSEQGNGGAYQMTGSFRRARRKKRFRCEATFTSGSWCPEPTTTTLTSSRGTWKLLPISSNG